MKKPPKPNHAYVDADLIIFPSASAGQQIEYYFVNEKGEEVGTFSSAAAAKNWLEECSIFGADAVFHYEGDFDKLVRHDRTHIGDFDTCVKTYERTLKRYLKEAGVESFTAYVAKKTGLSNFRHEAAIRKPYKGNRSLAAKPYYLDELREYVRKLPNHKTTVGNSETDDVVVGMASRKPTNVLIQNEKDGLQTVGCWVYFPDYHEAPVFSSPDTVGYVEVVSGKLLGLGHLFLLGQLLTGDTADHYSGLDGCGSVKAFEILSPFNNEPIGALEKAAHAVCDAYYAKYGESYEFKDKNKETVEGDWKMLLEETLQLAYMRKSRTDVRPEPYMTFIESYEPPQIDEEPK